jgi:hypothetical protein
VEERNRCQGRDGRHVEDSELRCRAASDCGWRKEKGIGVVSGDRVPNRSQSELFYTTNNNLPEFAAVIFSSRRVCALLCTILLCTISLGRCHDIDEIDDIAMPHIYLILLCCQAAGVLVTGIGWYIWKRKARAPELFPLRSSVCTQHFEHTHPS